MAPFHANTLTPGSVPTAIDMTNLSHTLEFGAGDYEVGTSTGKTFRLGVSPVGRIPSGAADTLELQQEADYEDFCSFMAEFIKIA